MAGQHSIYLKRSLLLFQAIQVVVLGETTLPPVVLPPIEKPVGPGHEGPDILYTPEQEAMLNSRKAITYLTSRWPDVNGFPEVPYTFVDSDVDQTKVEAAVQHWRDNTCIKFPKVASTYDSHHIHFRRHATACNSYVGKAFSDGQPINVPVWCENSFGSLVHEIGHALGMFHEQSRNDRDDYVVIITANIQTAALGNFNKANDNNYSVPYDFTSVMHYGSTGFSTNGNPTIATINPLYQALIGSRVGLSHMDVLLANRMYSCLDKWLASCSLTSDPCQNEGFTGSDCTCVCPSGTSGTHCETVTTPYLDSHLSMYTETITTEKTINTPNYPSNTIQFEEFQKYIIAPECKYIRLTFTDFRTYPKSTIGEEFLCYFEYIELRTSDVLATGPSTRYCDTVLDGVTLSTDSGEVFMHFETRVGGSYAKWSADITFYDMPGCSPVTTTTTTPPVTTTTTAPPVTTTTTTVLPVTTTTTPPVTTTTTPPVTTTTTPPVTTTTTPPVTTTTTPPVTTTTTPPVTTTTPDMPPIPECPSTDLGSSVKFTSNNYPKNYPNDDICQYENDQDYMKYAEIRFTKYKVKRGDKITIEHPYGPPITKTRSSRKAFSIYVPTLFRATFTSNSAKTSKGFSATVTERNGKCHGMIDASTSGSVMTPSYPKKFFTNNLLCEWKLSVPAGNRIQVNLTLKNVKCSSSYIAIDNNPGDSYVYDPTSVKKYCGKKTKKTFTSDSNEIVIFYYGKKKENGFKATYKMI